MSFTDPFGLDYWIEGPSAGEPAGHQSINVGNPNGQYDSYSFGVNGNINLRHGLEGEVYRDPIKGGRIDTNFYRKSTPAEDAVIRASLESQVGRKGAYTPWYTCRTYSQSKFKKLIAQRYGESSNPHPRTNLNLMDQPSSKVQSISSTITSSEPYGIPSRSTNKKK